MKNVAHAFSLVGGLLDALLIWVMMAVFGALFNLWWLLIIAFLYSVLVFAVLIWRWYSVEHGKKVACGVITLIFVSPLGGMFTLMIREEDLKENLPKPTQPVKLTAAQTIGYSAKKPPTEKDIKAREYEQQLRTGKITRNEFVRKIRELEKE